MTEKQHIAIHMYQPMRLTKDMIGALVVARDGKKIGRVYDVHIRKDSVIGIDIGPEKFHFHEIINIMKAMKTIPHIIRKVKGMDESVYVSWRDVRKIKNGAFVLEGPRPRRSKPRGISVVKRVLDEQVTDSGGRYIGRVDEVQFVYVYGERVIKAVGFYSGASAMLTRIGLDAYAKNLSKLFKIEFGRSIVPWKIVKKIESNPPARIILRVRSR